MRILLTGENGFIGSSLKLKLSALNHEVHCVSASVLNKTNTNIKNLSNFDCIIHSAGYTSDLTSTTVGQFFRYDLDFTSQLCENFAKIKKEEKLFIYMSSIAAADCTNTTAYAYVKRENEQTIRNICGETKSIILRLPSVFGPTNKKQLIYELVQKIKHNPAIIQLKGNENSIRHWVYIDDIVNRTIEALANESDRFVQLATEPMSVRELVKQISLYTNYGGLIKFMNNSTEANKPFVLDPLKAEAPFISETVGGGKETFQTQLATTIKYILKNE